MKMTAARKFMQKRKITARESGLFEHWGCNCARDCRWKIAGEAAVI